MAKIPKNLRYTKKEDIIKDLYEVLKLNITKTAKFIIVDELLWAWTEFYGKHIGCPYWSKAALEDHEKFKNPAEREIIKNFSYNKVFRHEHTIPRKVFRKYFLEGQSFTEQQIKDVFERLVVGVILTKDENDSIPLKDKMPEPLNNMLIHDFSETDKWARYKNTGIRIKRVEWEGEEVATRDEIII